MQEVIFTLRTLTPLFLTGADAGTAELRAPSFRGLMRYWHRALVGGLIGNTPHSLDRLRKAETALFGATDTGSAVAIKVSAASDKPKEFTEQTNIRGAGGAWQATGKGYLLWSMARSGKIERNNLKPARWYFPVGTSFQVTLTARGKDGGRLQAAVAAFWLLTQLGGVGSRSRRCAGSLAVQGVENNPTDLPFNMVENAAALKLRIEQGLKEAKKLTRKVLASAGEGQSLPVSQAEFDMLAPGVCRIWILQDEQPWPNAEATMRRLGEDLQSYRQDIPLPQRKIFGLPLPPMFPNKRRSSPLLLRVVELQGNKYVGIAVLFKTTGNDIALGDYQVIEKWINRFRGKQEVML